MWRKKTLVSIQTRVVMGTSGLFTPIIIHSKNTPICFGGGLKHTHLLIDKLVESLHEQSLEVKQNAHRDPAFVLLLGVGLLEQGDGSKSIERAVPDLDREALVAGLELRESYFQHPGRRRRHQKNALIWFDLIWFCLQTDCFLLVFEKIFFVFKTKLFTPRMTMTIDKLLTTCFHFFSSSSQIN